MKRNYVGVQYMGTYLTIHRKPSANLYYLLGKGLVEDSLKHLRFSNTKSRVHKSNIKDVAYNNNQFSSQKSISCEFSPNEKRNYIAE
jgi:hypothetical protein